MLEKGKLSLIQEIINKGGMFYEFSPNNDMVW